MSQTFPPVRLAALDLDGTLLNHEGQVTPRTRAALQAASDRGVVIVPTTGRPLGNLHGSRKGSVGVVALRAPWCSCGSPSAPSLQVACMTTSPV